MAIRTEISLRLPNTPGSLTQVCERLAGEHVNIMALQLENSGRLRIVVENPLLASGILREAYQRVEERQVLFLSLPNVAGAAARSLKLLADAGVNIEYAYASGFEGAPMAGLVVGVQDAERAAAAAGL